jgi:hypothetical protein
MVMVVFRVLRFAPPWVGTASLIAFQVLPPRVRCTPLFRGPLSKLLERSALFATVGLIQSSMQDGSVLAERQSAL